MKYNPETGSVRLEAVLARHLGRVSAPEELWERVRCPEAVRLRERNFNPGNFRLALVWAAAVIVAVTAGFYARHAVPRTGTAFTIEALPPSAESLELRSDRAAEIRSWINARTGFDVPLPDQPPAPIRLLGVRLVAAATPTVEVAYSVGDRKAELLISKAAPGAETTNRGHRSLAGEMHQGARTYSWVMRGQLYELACATPEDSQVACMLCHANPESQIAVN